MVYLGKSMFQVQPMPPGAALIYTKEPEDSEADVTASSEATISRCGGDEREHEVSDESGNTTPQDH